jgi:hypothetical protein
MMIDQYLYTLQLGKFGGKRFCSGKIIEVKTEEPVGLIQCYLCFLFLHFVIQYLARTGHPIDPICPIGRRNDRNTVAKLKQEIVETQRSAHCICVGFLVSCYCNLKGLIEKRKYVVDCSH